MKINSYKHTTITNSTNDIYFNKDKNIKSSKSSSKLDEKKGSNSKSKSKSKSNTRRKKTKGFSYLAQGLHTEDDALNISKVGNGNGCFGNNVSAGVDAFNNALGSSAEGSSSGMGESTTAKKISNNKVNSHRPTDTVVKITNRGFDKLLEKFIIEDDND